MTTAQKTSLSFSSSSAAARGEPSLLQPGRQREGWQRTAAGSPRCASAFPRSNPAVSFHCLNDMWALHLPSNTWTEVQVGSLRPPPRYGFSMVWSEDLHLSLFGGEGGHNITSKVSGKERILLEDLWHFKIKGIVNEARAAAPVVVGEWQQEKYEGKIGPRSHYSAIFITQRYQEPVKHSGFLLPAGSLRLGLRRSRLFSFSASLLSICPLQRAEPRTIERLMLISSGVTTVTENGRVRAVETDQINVYFFSKKQWCTVRPRYPADYIGDQYGARQRHVSCFFETQCVSRSSARPPVPCLFIHGGFRKHQVRRAAVSEHSSQRAVLRERSSALRVCRCWATLGCCRWWATTPTRVWPRSRRPPWAVSVCRPAGSRCTRI